ncbi:MAG: DJ-1/PfpI family protein [Phenylobacterium sp.]|uniref:DJ-1/PfpI family protein n=1 Tax=Phenylobacterium sp. TaxID=1871053 RepID=UPI001A56D775|nr:DJ-1/PfpI family protein [Phenylobacterium sp.]MBL8772551.1 DJ-1/PfpI family protein [Phenylobacterium sp.]
MTNETDSPASAGTRRAWIKRAAAGAGAAALAGLPAAQAQPRAGKKVVGVVLYRDFEVLDVFGPVEMWANAPGLDVILVAQSAGPVRSAQGVSVVADYSFDTAPPLDIMMAPGGTGTLAELRNETYLQYLRDQDRRTELTTSVCTGSALLAKAGLLKGRRATTNKRFFSIAASQDTSVDWVKRARWVEDGKYVTSSGVSAGTDMALAVVARLHGQDAARGLARALEYQWSENPHDDPFAIG